MLDLRLYVAQRLSALVLAPLVLVHLATIVVAVQGGLSVEEILSRTRGSAFWLAFYGIFVVAASIHAAIGLRTILHEWLGVGGSWLTGLSWCAGLGLLATGGRAVLAVTVS